MLTFDAKELASRLTLAEIDTIRTIKLESLAEGKARAEERARLAQEAAEKAAQAAQDAIREAQDTLDTSLRNREREKAFAEAIGQRTFFALPVYPQGKGGKPAAVDSRAVRDWAEQVRQAAASGAGNVQKQGAK